MPPTIVPDVQQVRGVTVITLGPECENLDEHILDQVRDVLIDTATRSVPPRVVLNLSHVKFFGSSFIEVLFRIWNRLRARKGGEFALAGVAPYCADVLSITQMDTLWKAFPTPAAAVAGLAEDERAHEQPQSADGPHQSP